MHVAFVQNLWREVPAVMALAAALRAEGHRVTAWVSGRRVPGGLRRDPPDLLALSLTTIQWPWARRFIGEFRREFPRTPIAVGGIHPTLVPAIIEEVPAISFLCRGEGDGAIADLAGALDRGRDPSRIRNLWVRRGRSIVRNPLRPLVEDLDALPDPDRSVYDGLPLFEGFPVRTIACGRGCLYRCSFCANAAVPRPAGERRPRVRMRGPDRVVAEAARAARRYRVKAFGFDDELFGPDPAWLDAFCTGWRRDVNVPFYVTSRPELLNDDAIGAVAAAGCKMLFLAVETGSERLRRAALDKTARTADFARAAAAARARGLPIAVNNLFGIPGERFEDALETIRLNQRLAPQKLMNAMLAFFPGLPITRKAIADGLLDPREVSRPRHPYGVAKSPLRQPEIEKVENLHRLSYIAIRHPALTDLVAALASLPPNPLFDLAYALSAAGEYVRGQRDLGLAAAAGRLLTHAREALD